MKKIFQLFNIFRKALLDFLSAKTIVTINTRLQIDFHRPYYLNRTAELNTESHLHPRYKSQLYERLLKVHWKDETASTTLKHPQKDFKIFFSAFPFIRAAKGLGFGFEHGPLARTQPTWDARSTVWARGRSQNVHFWFPLINDETKHCGGGLNLVVY